MEHDIFHAWANSRAAMDYVCCHSWQAGDSFDQRHLDLKLEQWSLLSLVQVHLSMGYKTAGHGGMCLSKIVMQFRIAKGRPRGTPHFSGQIMWRPQWLRLTRPGQRTHVTDDWWLVQLSHLVADSGLLGANVTVAWSLYDWLHVIVCFLSFLFSSHSCNTHEMLTALVELSHPEGCRLL